MLKKMSAHYKSPKFYRAASLFYVEFLAVYVKEDSTHPLQLAILKIKRKKH